MTCIISKTEKKISRCFSSETIEDFAIDKMVFFSSECNFRHFELNWENQPGCYFHKNLLLKPTLGIINFTACFTDTELVPSANIVDNRNTCYRLMKRKASIVQNRNTCQDLTKRKMRFKFHELSLFWSL